MREESLSGRRIMVTGGCGFIGGHLVDRLLRIPDTKVVVIDDCVFGRYTPTRNDEHYMLVQHRLGPNSMNLVKTHLRRNDIVFHLAAEKLHQSRYDQIALLNSNILGTWSVLEAAAQAGAARVILASSLYAHGRMTGPPLREKDPPQPTTIYGTTKLTCEHLLQVARQTAGLKGIALRLFFVYGPRQNGETGYPSVIVKNFRRLARDISPIICGNGRQALDYVYIDDVVRALLLAAESSLDGEVLNIGSGHAVSILDLTHQMQLTAGTDRLAEFIEADFTAGSRREADTTLTRERLGFVANISLEEGLEKTWAWLKKEGRT